MPVAFKEWAVTVRALAEGEQLLTLRKGGIREENKHFEIEHDRFFLYPTFDHQRNDLVRDSHMPELGRALEEGVWPDGEPPARALLQDGGIPQPDRVRIRAWAEVAASYLITDPRCRRRAVARTTSGPRDYAEKRLRVEAPPSDARDPAAHLPHPAPGDRQGAPRVPRLPLLDRAAPRAPFEGTPVLSDDEFERAARRSRRSPRTPCPCWPSDGRRIRRAARVVASRSRSGRQVCRSARRCSSLRTLALRSRRPQPRRPAVPGERRHGLPQHPAARPERPRSTRPSWRRSSPAGTRPAALRRPAADVRGPGLRHARA